MYHHNHINQWYDVYHLCTQGSISLGVHEKNEDFGAVLVSSVS